MSSWTDSRVATLRQMWGDGHSASQIAAALGGVTRNAVIGKVHRLGLSGRDRKGTGLASAASTPAAKAPAQAAAPAARPPAQPSARTPAPERSAKPRPAASSPSAPRPSVSRAAAAARPRPAPKPRPSSVPLQEPGSRARPTPSAPRIPQAVRDMAGRPFEAPQEAVRQEDGSFATVLTITDHMCKWPIGDPGAEDFRFCGRRTDPEEPYCMAHSRVAYQPSRRGVRSDKALPPVLRRKAIR